MMNLRLLLLLLTTSLVVHAQVTITPGTQLTATGNLQLTFQNIDLVNNGNFTAGNSRASFTGNIPSKLAGSQPLQFFDLEMNKSGNSSLVLQRAISVSDQILFSAGFLDLNGFNTDLGNTAHLTGESETSRVIGAAGGQVLFDTTLNAPIGANPANLGAIISSSKNMGKVIIRRGHQSQPVGSAAGKSILRYYQIIPANNTALAAILRFTYFDGELNGVFENSINLYNSNNGIAWTLLAATSKDAVANFAEKIGIDTFSIMTLSDVNIALTVNLVSFTTACEASNVVVKWKTAGEQNSSHFDVERSIDGIHWSIIGQVNASGNTIAEKEYSFTDKNPESNSLYRISEYGRDGSTQLSSIQKSSCNLADEFNLWPNPVHDVLTISINSSYESQGELRLYSSNGALVRIQQAKILLGKNQISLEVATLAKGIYTLQLTWNNGQSNKTIQILKE